jgi:hypothetical protein
MVDDTQTLHGLAWPTDAEVAAFREGLRDIWGPLDSRAVSGTVLPVTTQERI